MLFINWHLISFTQLMTADAFLIVIVLSAVKVSFYSLRFYFFLQGQVRVRRWCSLSAPPLLSLPFQEMGSLSPSL